MIDGPSGAEDDGESPLRRARSRRERRSEHRKRRRRQDVITKNGGPVEIDRPRELTRTARPPIVSSRQYRLGSVDDIVLSLYAKRSTTDKKDKTHFSESSIAVGESKPAVSASADRVGDHIRAWQSRMLAELHAVIVVDAVIVLGDGGRKAHYAKELVGNRS